MKPMSRLSRLSGFVLFMGLWSGVAQAATVTLAWDRSADPSVTGYTLYWGNQSGSYPSSLNVGNLTQAQVAGLTDGMPYYFVVRAYNSSGMLSAPSVEVSTPRRHSLLSPRRFRRRFQVRHCCVPTVGAALGTC